MYSKNKDPSSLRTVISYPSNSSPTIEFLSPLRTVISYPSNSSPTIEFL